MFEVFNYIEGLDRREDDLVSMSQLDHNPKVMRKLIESLPNATTTLVFRYLKIADLVFKYLRIGNGINLEFAKSQLKLLNLKKFVPKLR